MAFQNNSNKLFVIRPICVCIYISCSDSEGKKKDYIVIYIHTYTYLKCIRQSKLNIHILFHQHTNRISKRFHSSPVIVTHYVLKVHNFVKHMCRKSKERQEKSLLNHLTYVGADFDRFDSVHNGAHTFLHINLCIGQYIFCFR